MTTRGAPSPCPYCGVVHDAFTDAWDTAATPQPGDISLCIDCAEPAIFDATLRRRRVTPAERANLLVDPDVTRAQAAIRAANARGPAA